MSQVKYLFEEIDEKLLIHLLSKESYIFDENEKDKINHYLWNIGFKDKFLVSFNNNF